MDTDFLQVANFVAMHLATTTPINTTRLTKHKINKQQFIFDFILI